MAVAPPAPWRVVIITGIPPVAAGYAMLVRALGHEPVAVITTRRNASGAAAFVGEATDGIDVAFAARKASLAPLLAAYDADLGLCTGFPWLIPKAAIDVPALGIVIGHPSLLPRYRGPFPIAWAIRNGESEIGLTYHFMDAEFDTGNVLAQQTIPLVDNEDEETLIPKLEAASAHLLPQVFAKLAAGDPGEPQGEGEYQHGFEPEFIPVDPTRTAAEIHRQVHAWSFMPPFVGERGAIHEGRRLLRTSLTEVDGAERLDCGDGPLWILEVA
jgi:methionyl-tRNA formyltransferase